jgi:hypothetical protein
MKRILFYAALLCGAAGCLEEEKPNLSLILGEKGAAEGALRDTMARLEEDYGVAFEWDFFASDYSPVGTGTALPYTKVTDYGKVLELTQYVERRVFSFFTPAFIKEYMPRNVFLVDSLISVYRYNDEVAEVTWTQNRTLTGNITDRYMVLGNVGERLDTAAPGLQEELLSLFIEYFFSNNRMPPIPDGIKAATEQAATEANAVIFLSGKPNNNYPYLGGGIGAPYIRTWAGVGYDSTATPWLGRGILKMGRLGMVAYEHAMLLGIDLRAYEIYMGTLAQDFADFAAFILLHSPEEREAFYAQVEASSKVYEYAPYPPDTRFPYGGLPGAKAMRTKDRIVSDYLREILNSNF